MARPEPTRMNRRMLLRAGIGSGLAAAASGFWTEDVLAHDSAIRPQKYRTIFRPLDRFIERYMRDMNAPAMIVVLADREGVHRIASYGCDDLQRRHRIGVDGLFHIGSISKSFLALALLQLQEEGKLDFHRPIVEYLPWLRIQSAYEPITTHHLLTHSSGLPGLPQVLLSDPAQSHLAAYAPGQHFHYNNMGYGVLGHLAWTLDGRELPQLLRERIFQPLGMIRSEPVIDFDMRASTVPSYWPDLSERPYARFDALYPAPAIVHTNAAGSIASTARDMGAYLQMLANRGQGTRGALVTPGSFAAFSQRYISAADFGPTAGYGYGIAVDKVDGHSVLLHTGGMVSFASSLLVDIDAGVGAFASINAQQGYRPNPVVSYATQLMQSQRAGTPRPAIPPVSPATFVPNSTEYVGRFIHEDGRHIELISESNRMFLRSGPKRVALQAMSQKDHFIAQDREWGLAPLIFGRAEATSATSPVVELSWSGDWYTNRAYNGPRSFDVPTLWRSYVGHYRNENPWLGSIRIVLIKGRLAFDDGTALIPDGEIFRLRGEPSNTEWIRFGEIVNNKCMRLKFSGEDMWRVPVR